MKSIQVLFVFCFFIIFAESSFGINKVVIIDGQEYMCQPKQQDSSPACANKAYSGPFSKAESIKLCAGASSTAPADCALKVYSGPFSKSESVQLCTGAITSGPGDCAILAYSGPFSKSESLDLCKAALSDQPAKCALDAYSGPFSKQESIDMCKPNYQNIATLPDFFSAKTSKNTLNKEELFEIIKKANIKAFELNEYK